MAKSSTGVTNRNPRRDNARLSSVTTAIHLLKTFTNEDYEFGISELSKRLSVAKSTVHRLATALLEEGLLQQSPENGRYRLGVGLFSLGSLVRAQLDVTNVSKALLNDLRERTQENVRLAILEQENIVFLHDFESPQAVRLRSSTGRLKPAFCTAEGLCLLSGLGQSELDEILLKPRSPRTKKTVLDEDEIRKRIIKTKTVGYAVEDEECEDGTRCIAAPIRNGDGQIIAAIGVAGPQLRLVARKIPKMAPLVIGTAERISEQLGYRRLQHQYV
jgi:DNA-binding IclR family transcriptional regulator